MSEDNKSAAPEANATSDNTNKSQTNTGPKKEEAWGYDLYPERRGTFTAKLGNILIGKEGKENIDKFKCEQHVVDCVKNSKCFYLFVVLEFGYFMLILAGPQNYVCVNFFFIAPILLVVACCYIVFLDKWPIQH